MDHTETVYLPRLQFAALATRKSAEMVEQINAKLPRADDLQVSLNALTQEARAKGIQLDDETTLSDPAAADLRGRIDVVVEEVCAILAEIQSCSNINKQMQSILADGAGTGGSVEVPVPLAAILLNLKPTG